MKTARNRAAQWTRNLKARELAKRLGRITRAYASRFLVRHEGGLYRDHKPVWRTKQFTEPGYVKPIVAGSTEEHDLRVEAAIDGEDDPYDAIEIPPAFRRDK